MFSPEIMPLFKDVSNETLEKTLSKGNKINIRSKETVININEPAKGLYIIKSGIVKVSSINQKGKKTLLFLLGENKSFGVNAFMPESLFAIEVSTLSDVELFFIPKALLHERIKNDSKFMFNMFNWICLEIERIETNILTNLKTSITSRFAALLLNTEFKNRNIFSLSQLSLEEIADLLGTSKTYLQNTINKLRKQKLIDYDRKTITILNSVELRKLIEKSDINF